MDQFKNQVLKQLHLTVEIFFVETSFKEFRPKKKMEIKFLVLVLLIFYGINDFNIQRSGLVDAVCN